MAAAGSQLKICSPTRVKNKLTELDLDDAKKIAKEHIKSTAGLKHDCNLLNIPISGLKKPDICNLLTNHKPPLALEPVDISSLSSKLSSLSIGASSSIASVATQAGISAQAKQAIAQAQQLSQYASQLAAQAPVAAQAGISAAAQARLAAQAPVAAQAGISAAEQARLAAQASVAAQAVQSPFAVRPRITYTYNKPIPNFIELSYLKETQVHPFKQFKATPIGNTIPFTIISWNMNKGHCYINFSEINDILPYADVIVTQDDSHSLNLLRMIPSSCGGLGLYSKMLIEKPSCVSPINEEPSNKKRYVYTATVNGIKISNIHLEGGRSSDRLVLNADEKILGYKMKLLELVIKENPLIIAGSFNSVYSQDAETYELYMNNQFDYFTGLNGNPLSEEQRDFILKWNQAPYNVLLESGYQYARPKNNSYTSQLAKTSVDSIWYKNLNIVDSYILDLPYTDQTLCISDHNPVVATFSLGDRVIEDEKEFIMPINEDTLTCNKVINRCDKRCIERLSNGPIVQAFHATTEENAIRIWNSGRFLCGSTGTFGGGIYLCPRPLDCIYKASRFLKKNIYLFEVDVQMGNSIIDNKSLGERPNLKFDSVIFKRDTGIEYIVYRPMQVRIRNLYHVLTRNISDITFSYIQLRSQSFEDMNAYILGGWKFRQIPFYDLGPYELDIIQDRMPICDGTNGLFCNDKKIVSRKDYREMSITGKKSKNTRKSKKKR